MNLKKRFHFMGGLFLSLLILLSCNIGMGQSLDLEPPVLTVTSHINSAKVGLEFDLAGTCRDNIGVTRVTIEDPQGEMTFEDAVVTGETWKSHIKVTKDFEGDRTFIITAHDAANNEPNTKSYAILILTIDETAPNDVDWYIDRGNAIRTEITDLETLQSKNLYFSENKDIPQNESFIVYGSLYDAMSIKEAKLSLFTVGGKALISKTFSSDPDDANYIGSDKSIFSPAFEFTHDELKDLVDDDESTLESGVHYLQLKCYMEDEHGNNFSRDIGYMVWWPESDLPGIYQSGLNLETNTLSVLIEAEVPLDIFDDDGLEEIYYALKVDTVYSTIPGATNAEKCEAVINNKNGIRDQILKLNTAQSEVGGSATNLSTTSKRDNPVTIRTPSVPTTMYLIACAKDIHGKWNCRIIYTTISDATSPMLFIESPRNNEKPVMNAGENTFTIKGYSLGKNECSSLEIVYISGDDSAETKKATALAILDGTQEADASKGQIKEELTLAPYVMDGDLKKQTFEKTFDIITELSQYNKEKETAYFFMFRLKGVGSTIDQIYQLNKDIAKPTIEVVQPNNMQAIDYTKNGLTIKFKASKDSGLAIVEHKVTFGSTTWTVENGGLTKDNEYFVKTLTKEELAEIKKNNPQPQFDIYVKDALGYESTEQRTIVLTALPTLDEITTEMPSKTYIKGEVLTFQAKFSSAVRVINQGAEKPALKLKFSGTQSREAVLTAGNGTTTLVFSYEIKENDASNGVSIETIDTNKTAIQLKGARVIPVSGGDGDAFITVEDESISFTGIKVKASLPTISTYSLSCDKTKDGSYKYVKADDKLTITVGFSEDIFISGNPAYTLKVKDGNTYTDLVFNLKDSASNELTFEHTVKTGTPNGVVYNASGIYTLNGTSVSPIDVNNISDIYGNKLILGSVTAVATDILIDTEAPGKPKVSLTALRAAETVYSQAPTLTVSDTVADCTVEYSTDNGVNWNIYTTTPALKIGNGTHKITARQTDKAGNVSELADVVDATVNVEFPEVIDASILSPDGYYGAGKKLKFGLWFTDKVFVTDDSVVTLTFQKKNDSSVSRTAIVIKTDSTKYPDGQNTIEFEYEVSASDNITGIEIVSVTYNKLVDELDHECAETTYNSNMPSAPNIVLDGIKPTISSYSPAMNGTSSGLSTLGNAAGTFAITLTFAENVYKETGTIILQRKAGWAIPAVMTSDEFLKYYNQMTAANKEIMMKTDSSTGKELLHSKTGIAVGPYRKITHGLKESNSKYVPDESTKYVLAYELGLYSGTAELSDGKIYGGEQTPSTFTASVSDIRKALESVDYHRHKVDVAGSNVTVNGTTVTIKFDEAIEDGREWELIIPSTAFRDNAENFYDGMNLNEDTDKYSLWSNNIATPVVRVDRYTHGWGANEPVAAANNTVRAYEVPAAGSKWKIVSANNGKYKTTCAENTAARIAPSGFARSRIDCETPGVQIKYKTVGNRSAAYNANTTTDDSRNTSVYKNYRSSLGDASTTELDFTKTENKKTGGTDYSQGNDIIIGDSTYTSARKDYIACYAVKTDSTPAFNESEVGREGIFRTVVYVKTTQDKYTDGNKKQHNNNFAINIEGGTAPGGQPNLDGFPLRDATNEKDPNGDGRFSKNCYNIDYSSAIGKEFVFVSYEIISTDWAVLVCRGNHSQDYPLCSYGNVAYIPYIKDWNSGY